MRSRRRKSKKEEGKAEEQEREEEEEEQEEQKEDTGQTSRGYQRSSCSLSNRSKRPLVCKDSRGERSTSSFMPAVGNPMSSHCQTGYMSILIDVFGVVYTIEFVSSVDTEKKKKADAM